MSSLLVTTYHDLRQDSFCVIPQPASIVIWRSLSPRSSTSYMLFNSHVVWPVSYWVALYPVFFHFLVTHNAYYSLLFTPWWFRFAQSSLVSSSTAPHPWRATRYTPNQPGTPCLWLWSLVIRLNSLSRILICFFCFSTSSSFSFGKRSGNSNFWSFGRVT